MVVSKMTLTACVLGSAFLWAGRVRAGEAPADPAAKAEAERVKQLVAEARREYAVLDEKDAPVEARREASVTVNFSLKGSEAVRRTHLSRGGGITLDRDDTLLVVMKKLGDTWYWNPFGR